MRLFRPKAGIFGLFGRISVNFVALCGVILLLSLEYFDFILNFFEILSFLVESAANRPFRGDVRFKAVQLELC